MTVTKIPARNATIKYTPTAITFATTSTLAASMTAQGDEVTITSAKNVTVTIPKSEVELVPLLGETAQVIGSNIPVATTAQNCIIDEKNYGMSQITGTLVLKGDEDFEPMIFGSGTQIATNTYTRYGMGDSASGKKRVVVGSILVDLNNGSENVSVAMANISMNLGDMKPTGADGHWEVDFDGSCLPENTALEYKD